MQIGAILWAYRKVSLLIATAVIAAAAVACMMWPRSYVAIATLMVDFEVNDPTSGREFPTGLLGSYMATQIELARGSKVLLPVIDHLNLAEKKEYAGGYSGDSTGLPNWVDTQVRKRLLVEQGRYGSQLIYITYTASSPAEAALVANAVADTYAQQQFERMTGPASDRAKQYTERLAELKTKLTLAEEEFTSFRQRSGLVGVDARVDVDMRSTLIESLKGQLSTLNAKMGELQPTLGARHPQILELKSQLAVTRQALDSEMRAFSGKAGSELTGAKYQLELLSAQAVYARALDGYDQVMFASTGGYSNVSFVSRATPPTKASKPKVRIAMALAGMIGIALGLALPLLYELFNRRVRCRDDVERDHGIPVLAELGSITNAAALPKGASA
ncbi:MAG: hypothetical protein M3O62_05885 [Pseudomonadota bacterium]|nr:hypothetical protein [Pseudomonadota bacterium]